LKSSTARVMSVRALDILHSAPGSNPFHCGCRQGRRDAHSFAAN
jgi:hypothetical protein